MLLTTLCGEFWPDCTEQFKIFEREICDGLTKLGSFAY